jgi:uncharacterized membrane protein
MPICRFLLAMLFLYISAVSYAQQITCSSWQFFRVPAPGASFSATGIDSSGTVVGVVTPSQSTVPHGFVRSSDGTYRYYLVPNSMQTIFLHRSNLGVNVGSYEDSAYITHGLVVSGRKYTSEDYPGETITELTSINRTGTIIGFHQNPSIGGTFRLKNGVFTDINYPGTSSTNARSINDNGVVVGSYLDPIDSSPHGFLLQDGTYTTLDNPKAERYSGTGLDDINNSGTIVGGYSVRGIGHSFIYKDGMFADINPPNGFYTTVTGINDLGDVVGNTNLPSGFTMFTAHCQ